MAWYDGLCARSTCSIVHRSGSASSPYLRCSTRICWRFQGSIAIEMRRHCEKLASEIFKLNEATSLQLDWSVHFDYMVDSGNDRVSTSSGNCCNGSLNFARDFWPEEGRLLRLGKYCTCAGCYTTEVTQQTHHCFPAEPQ